MKRNNFNLKVTIAIISALGLITVAYISKDSSEEKVNPTFTNAPVINNTVNVQDTLGTEQKGKTSVKNVEPKKGEVLSPNVKIREVNGPVNIAEKQEIDNQTVNN